ncbi:MAG: hypothetical protein RM338_03640 [Nostoc sp. DedQUE12a]|nr:hypothetical protein [Nostoc sp. DedQUE12a]
MLTIQRVIREELGWMPGVGVIKASKRWLLIEFPVMGNLGKEVPYKFPTQRSLSL